MSAIIGVIIVAFILFSCLFLVKNDLEYLKKLARQTGLTYYPAIKEVKGQLGNQWVRIIQDRSYRGLRIFVRPPRPYPGNLTVTRQNTPASIKKILMDIKFKTCDDWFDSLFKIDGDDELLVLGLFNHQVRRGMIKLASYADIVIYDHQLIYAPVRRSLKEIMEIIPQLVEINQQLLRGGSVCQRLILNFLQDPLLPVARHNIDLAVSNFRFGSREWELIKLGLNHPHWEIRLMVLNYIRPCWLPWDLVHYCGLLEIIPALQAGQVFDLLKELLPRQLDMVLQQLYEQVVSLSICTAILHYMEKHPQPAYSPFLINILEAGQFPDTLLIELVRALGTCGTVEALGPLYQLARNRYFAPLVKADIAQAQQKIKSRVGICGEGWLSLTGDREETGALSVNKEHGQLGYAEEADEDP